MVALDQSVTATTPRFRPASPTFPCVVASVCYVVPTGERLYNCMYDPSDGSPQHNCQYAMHGVHIADARSLSTPASVHIEGFELWDAPSQVVDFRDDELVRRVYHRECAELACAATGGKRAYVFDHTRRKREARRPPPTFGRHGDGSKPAAAGRIHNDFTEASGPRRLAAVLSGTGQAHSVRRYCLVNIWRSIAGPVLDTPLTLCDARSVAAADLQISEVRYLDRVGEIYLLSYSPLHQWFYYSRMDRHEALVFKQYDSQINGVARYTPHAAFDLPDIPADAPLRESIEVRCLVVME